MFDLGFLTIPLLSMLTVFGFAVVTDVNMITFDVKSVPQMAQNMGYDAKNVRNTIMYKVYKISDVANTSRGVMYSTIGNMQQQSLQNISETLGIKDSVLAVQGVLGLIPYRLKGKIVQEGDILYMVITGFSSENDSFSITLKSNKVVFDSAQVITGQAGSFLGGKLSNTENNPNTTNTQLITSNVDIEIGSLLTRAAEAIVDRIDPYLLARYYFVQESPTAKFTKTLPQLIRCIDVLPKQQSIWPLLLLGRSYHFRGNYTKAIRIYKEIDKIDRHFPFTSLRWGEALAAQGNHDPAIKLYQLAIANSRYYPKYPVARSAAYSLWADSLIALGKLDEAERVLRIGERLIPAGHERSVADALSHYALGKFLMKYRQDYKNAKHHLRQAVYKDGRPKYYKTLQNLNKILIPGYQDYATAKQQQADNSSISKTSKLSNSSPDTLVKPSLKSSPLVNPNNVAVAR